MWRATLRLWTPYILYDKISIIKLSDVGGLYMAEKCICCGKKIGLLNGSHLNNQVCDNCYFPINGYLTSIKEGSTIQILEENYNQLIQKIEASAYSPEGKNYLIQIADNIINANKSGIQLEARREHTRKNFKITTSHKFEGYKIIKYHGLVSGSTVLGTGFLSEGRAAVSDVFGIENDSFSNKLEQIKDSSVKKMISEAINQGGNALIGVTFDYVNFTSNMIGVVANGTAVEITEEE